MKFKKHLLLVPLVMLVISLCAQEKTGFQIEGGQFIYNNKPVVIRSGEIHYPRVPYQYWRHRLRMIKALGLNCVTTYVFWNFHHPDPHTWDFQSDEHNLKLFITLAKEEGLLVILRPGPYVCAEWEFGGYPWWLQQNPELRIRADNPAFLDSCKVYFEHLSNELKGLHSDEGGPVILVQVENEFGSYVVQRKDVSLAEHKTYNKKIFGLLQQTGIKGPYFTSDGSSLFAGGTIEGVLPTANGEDDVDNLKKKVDEYHKGGPYMVAEYYPGWLDHWKEPFVRVNKASVEDQLSKYLINGINFNIYMVHGGTNFGFTSGANYNTQHPIQPDITSYDYDAPISEAGWATEKYDAIRKLLLKFNKESVIKVPRRNAVLPARKLMLSGSADLLDQIPEEPVHSERPLSFGDLKQGHGFVYYNWTSKKSYHGLLKVSGLRDYARVFINGKLVGELDRIDNKFDLPVDLEPGDKLGLLVENLGRINYGAEIVNNEKGIIAPVYIDSNELTGSWEMKSIPLNTQPQFSDTSGMKKGRPAMYRYNFNLKKTGDTFLNMRSWGKGVVFVNGHNLGRYWNIGPQQTLYVPGCWLKKEANEIVVIELINTNEHSSLEMVTQPVLDELRENN